MAKTVPLLWKSFFFFWGGGELDRAKARRGGGGGCPVDFKIFISEIAANPSDFKNMLIYIYGELIY